MTPDELERILAGRFTVKRKKDEVCIQTCVFCGNPKHNLELNADRGVFKCWACNASGTVRNFLQEFCNLTVDVPVQYEGSGDIYSVPKDHLDLQMVPVQEVPTAMAYLQRRGFGLHEALKYGINFCNDETEGGQHMKYRLLLPAREYYSQSLFGYVGRAFLPGQSPKYWATFTARMVAGLRIFDNAVHVVVEGLFDGMAVHRAGYNAAVLLGVDASPTLLDYWAARVPQDDKIVLLLDGEARERSDQYYWRMKRLHAHVLQFHLPPKMDPAMLEERAVTALVTTIIEREVQP